MKPTEWSDPSRTWPLASYEPPERRKAKVERRTDPRRSALGDRRKESRRSLRSLLRF
jgi:hypothetical protein